MSEIKLTIQTKEGLASIESQLIDHGDSVTLASPADGISIKATKIEPVKPATDTTTSPTRG